MPFPFVTLSGCGRSAISAVLAFAIVSEAVAQVGVTSATSGDPLGKPPAAVERVLRIGTDIQANELVTTHSSDRAHLVFLDGTSLTVGPNARVTIDRFVFDPSTSKGELAVNVSRGVFRLVGGKISKTTPMTVTTPAATIGVRGGIAVGRVTDERTDASFLFGKSLAATARGVTRTATRPGSRITTRRGEAPGDPVVIARGELDSDLAELEGKTGTNGRELDEYVKNSGVAENNSGRNPNRIQTERSILSSIQNSTVVNALTNVETSRLDSAAALSVTTITSLGSVPPFTGGPPPVPPLTPPGGGQPSVNPPVVVSPPVVSPPIVNPPVVIPPVVIPPVIIPPVVPPPVVSVPVVDPPVVSPPVVPPPVITPPIVSPIVNPPVVPVVDLPPTSHGHGHGHGPGHGHGHGPGHGHGHGHGPVNIQ